MSDTTTADTTTAQEPRLYDLGHNDLVPNLAWTEQRIADWAKNTAQAAVKAAIDESWTRTAAAFADILPEVLNPVLRAMNGNIEARCKVYAQAAAEAALRASNEHTRTALESVVKQITPYLEKAAAIDPEQIARAATGVTEAERQAIIAAAVVEARTAALDQVTLTIPEIIRTTREGTTKVAFTKDRDGRITGAEAVHG